MAGGNYSFFSIILKKSFSNNNYNYVIYFLGFDVIFLKKTSETTVWKISNNNNKSGLSMM